MTHWLKRMLWRLEVLFRKERLEDELREELEDHLRREIQENIANGMSPADARRQALIDFGGVERTKERVRDERGARVLGDLDQDLRYSLRRMGRNPAFSIGTILTLTVGIAATVAMFSILDAALFRALPFPHPDRLVLGRTTFRGRINPFSSFPDYMDYRDSGQSLQDLAAFLPQVQRFPVVGSHGAEIAEARIVTTDFFRALAVEAEAGRTFSPGDVEAAESDVAVISHGFWQRWFGGEDDAVGRVLNIDGFPRTVVGIMPAGFRFMAPVDVWLPVRMGTMDTEGRNSHSWLSVGRMKAGVTLRDAQVEMDVVTARLAAAYPADHATKGFVLTPLGEALAEGYRPALLVLMGATSLLLLIACGNVAGLQAAKATSRRAEFSLRTALGAARSRLVRQLLAESLFLALAAGTLGTLLAFELQRAILALFPLSILGITGVGLSGSMLLFALLVVFATVVLSGLMPAWSAARGEPGSALRTSARTSSSGTRAGRLRGALVGLQVALSVVLLAGSALLVQSFVRLRSVDMGFRQDHLITANLTLPPLAEADPVSTVQFFEGVREDVAAIPEVVSVSLVNKIPILQTLTNWSVWDADHPPDGSQSTPSAFARFVLPGYFRTMDVSVVQGRDLESRDAELPLPPVVINAVMAEDLFPGQNSLGRRLAVNFLMSQVREFQVVGVVGNMRITSVGASPGYQMYFPYAVMPSSSMQVVVRTRGDPSPVVSAIRRLVAERSPDVPVTQVATMTDIVSRSINGSRVLSLAVSVFAVTALLLALTGLYALLAYHVGQRTHEIGVRVALGATRGRVLRGVVREGLLLVFGGSVVGVAAALAVGRVLRTQLYQVSPADPATFIGVAAGLIAVGAVASFVPALRASRVDPVRAMRSE